MSADGKTVELPEWVAVSAYSAIALGTLWGGWKIIETLALKITTLHASSGVAANIGASTAIFGATAAGMPISTTHAAASSIVGAGVGSRRGAHWSVVGRMALAWVLTIPSSAAVAWLMFHLTRLPTVLAWVTVGGLLLAFASWAGWAMTHTIHAKDVEAEIPSELELNLRDIALPTAPAREPTTAPAQPTNSV
jgi:PiT family inorganic phosphate transporter